MIRLELKVDQTSGGTFDIDVADVVTTLGFGPTEVSPDRIRRVVLARRVPAHFDIGDALMGIDGEIRAMGLRPDGEAWTVAVEEPDPERRAPHLILALRDCSVATSGDYRHLIEVQGRRLSHTMDPERGSPLSISPASVTVIVPTCAETNAWATGLMVLGSNKGGEPACRLGLNVLFLLRGDVDSICSCRIGGLFGGAPMSVPAEGG